MHRPALIQQTLSAAKRIAETYGLLVLELRLPTTGDLEKRLEALVITINPMIPVVTDVAIEVMELLDAEAGQIETLGRHSNYSNRAQIRIRCGSSAY
jgi:hypothetical protein